MPPSLQAPVAIVADDRELQAPVIAALRKRADVSVTIQRLPLGDYKAGSSLLFERKTLRDFAESIADGRLFNQGHRLAASPLKAVLIIEGTAADLAATGVRREAMQGALISISVIFGVPVLRSLNADESARLIVYAAYQAARIDAQGLHRPGHRPKGVRKRQLFVLQSLPGIGPDRAARLLDFFGSLEAVFSADAEDLCAVTGIGTSTAATIRRLMQARTEPRSL